MNDGGENQNFAALKKLLISWNVGILYELFKEEDININELKMMQISHANALLKNYKMGVKIRFEYHFNSWRNRIGIPLKPKDFYHPESCSCSYRENIRYNSIDHPNVAITSTNTPTYNYTKRRKLHQELVPPNPIELDENQPPLSPQSVKSNQSFVNILTSNELVNFTPTSVSGSPNQKTLNNTDDETEMENLPINTLSKILSDSACEAQPKFPSKQTLEKCPVTLKQILQMSGTRGMSILNFFREKNRLTNIHRTQLIQTIVDFFDENDYHLSLNMSHNLEWEILKMFPTEKLEYYRTEKRGKIYVKFSNMKRYKRERCNKVKIEIESMNRSTRRTEHNKESNNGEDNVERNNSENMENYIENWYVEPEILVKEERLSDN